MAQVRIALLGGVQAWSPSGQPITLPGNKARALLGYLASQSGQAHPRDKLATLLWAESSRERARHSLRQALTALRQALPRANPRILLEGDDTVTLNPVAADVDVWTFKRLVAVGTAQSLDQAVGLYQGDLLAGLGGQSGPFEDWLLTERERLRELALEALARLLGHYSRGDLVDEAIQTAHRLLALDPIEEAVHRSLMQLYARRGRLPAALRQYQRCVDALQRELGSEPDAETREVYRQLLQSRAAGRPESRPVAAVGRQPAHAALTEGGAGASETPLVGRAGELAEMGAALDRARTGRGQVALILGEAGIGKSRLLQALATESLAREARVLLGRAHESAQILPFGPWVDMLRTAAVTADETLLRNLGPVWRAELGRLLPELQAPGLPPPSDELPRLFESVARLVELLADGSPVLVLMLEDLHWADAITPRLLAFLARRVASRPVLIVATIREEELPTAATLPAVIDELGREPHVTSLVLAPLSRADTAELVRSLARSGSDETDIARLGDRVWAASEGNPFMVVETMRVLHEGTAPLTPGGLPLPERVRRVIIGRLQRLGERGRELAAVAAVIGRAFQFALLERASSVGERAAAEGVEELVRRRVLHGREDHFEFTHDRIREVVYTELLLPRRRLLHRQVVEAFEQLYPDRLSEQVDLLAHHALRAESWLKAVTYLRQAGTTAFARSANREAVAYFEQALDALAHLPPSREGLEQAVDLRFDIRTALVALGDFEGVFNRLREAEGLTGPLEDPRRHAWVSVYMAHYFILTGQFAQALTYAESAGTIARSVEDLALRVGATHYLGWVRLSFGDYAGADDCFRTVVGLLEGGRTGERCGLTGFPAVMARWLLAESLGERGRFAEALAHAENALRIAEGLDHAFSLILACWALASAHGRKGQLGESTRLYERALGISREWNIGLLSPHVTAWLGITYARSGRAAEGLPLIEHALKTFEQSPSRVFHSSFVAYEGEAYLLTGTPQEALQRAERALTLTRARGERGSEAWALHLLGEASARETPAGVERAEGYYRQALALADELGMRPLVAHCHLGLGRLLRRAGARARALDHLTTAAAMYRELDMTSWVEQAEAEPSLEADTLAP